MRNPTKDLTAAFQLLRRWLLQHATVHPDPDHQIRILCGYLPNYREQLDQHVWSHDWAAEVELADVREYSHNRATRILARPTRFPPIVYDLLLRQMFTASDHGIATQLTGAPSDLVNLFNKNWQLPDMTGAYLARRPADLAEMRLKVANLAAGKNLDAHQTRWLTHMARVFAAADVARLELFHTHLAALLGAAEYAMVRDMHPDILRNLYGEIWHNGDMLYPAHLSRTQQVTFRHYDEHGAWRYPYPFWGAGAKKETLAGVNP